MSRSGFASALIGLKVSAALSFVVSGHWAIETQIIIPIINGFTIIDFAVKEPSQTIEHLIVILELLIIALHPIAPLTMVIKHLVAAKLVILLILPLIPKHFIIVLMALDHPLNQTNPLSLSMHHCQINHLLLNHCLIDICLTTDYFIRLKLYGLSLPLKFVLL